MSNKTEMTYGEAMARLQDIVSKIDSGELEIDQLADRIREANELIAFCHDKLAGAEAEVKKMSFEDGTGE